MSMVESKANTNDIKAALDRVVEALGTVVSQQIGAFFRVNLAKIAVAFAALSSSMIGVILLALAIKDSVVTAFPAQPILAVAAVGTLAILLGVGVSFAYRYAALKSSLHELT